MVCAVVTQKGFAVQPPSPEENFVMSFCFNVLQCAVKSDTYENHEDKFVYDDVISEVCARH